MLVGGMVEHKVHDNADSLIFSGFQQRIHVIVVSIERVDVVIIRHVVSVVLHRRNEHRSKPDSPYAKICKMIKALCNPLDVTVAVSVCILKTVYIDLVGVSLLLP